MPTIPDYVNVTYDLYVLPTEEDLAKGVRPIKRGDTKHILFPVLKTEDEGDGQIKAEEEAGDAQKKKEVKKSAKAKVKGELMYQTVSEVLKDTKDVLNDLERVGIIINGIEGIDNKLTPFVDFLHYLQSQYKPKETPKAEKTLAEILAEALGKRENN